MCVCVCVCVCSYRGNPSMGDPETLMDELLEMRNKIRMKKSELVMIKRKVCLYDNHSDIRFFKYIGISISPEIGHFTQTFVNF